MNIMIIVILSCIIVMGEFPSSHNPTVGDLQQLVADPHSILYMHNLLNAKSVTTALANKEKSHSKF